MSTTPRWYLRDTTCVWCRQTTSGDCGQHGQSYSAQQLAGESVIYTTTAGVRWPDLTDLLREVRAVPDAWHALPADLQRRITAALESEEKRP